MRATKKKTHSFMFRSCAGQFGSIENIDLVNVRKYNTLKITKISFNRKNKMSVNLYVHLSLVRCRNQCWFGFFVCCGYDIFGLYERTNLTLPSYTSAGNNECKNKFVITAVIPQIRCSPHVYTGMV